MWLPLSPPPTQTEHMLPVPKKFSGELDKCGGFLTQCALVFWQQTQACAADRQTGAKITLMVQLMTGRALKWSQAMLSANPHVTYKDVSDKFCCVVDKGSNQDLDREKGVWLTFKWTSGFWLWRPVGRRRHSGRIP